MFGKKETEKRSLEDMFKPRSVGEETNGETTSQDSCDSEQDDADIALETAQETSCITIKPLDCFGMGEEKTDKWLGNCAKFWFCCMSFVWFLFGALTFAPVIFISNKVNVIFKNKKKSLLCATVIHGLILALIAVLLFVK